MLVHFNIECQSKKFVLDSNMRRYEDGAVLHKSATRLSWGCLRISESIRNHI